MNKTSTKPESDSESEMNIRLNSSSLNGSSLNSSSLNSSCLNSSCLNGSSLNSSSLNSSSLNNSSLNDSSFYMQKALLLARKAFSMCETPIGAVIVKDGEILSIGYNLRESKQDVTSHAEIIAIRKACKKLKSWRLDNCDLYVTLEPCVMCAGAIQQAKIRKVYFGAYEPKGGGIVSKARILDLALNHIVQYEGGIHQEESSELIKSFFSSMRAKDKETGLSKGQRRIQNKKH